MANQPSHPSPTWVLPLSGVALGLVADGVVHVGDDLLQGQGWQVESGEATGQVSAHARWLSYAAPSPARLSAAQHRATAAAPAADLQAACGLECVHEGAQAAHVHLAGARHIQDGVDQVVVCLEERGGGGIIKDGR